MALPQDIRPVNSELADSITRSAEIPWIETKPGEAWTKVLWVGPESGRWAVLLKWKKGYVAPPHKHLSAAFAFILSGKLQVRNNTYNAGDFLHEVAHVALTPPSDRPAMDEWVTGTEAQEVSALAWTWAAGHYLGLEPSDVFHDAIISGNGPTLRENFCDGHYVGVPMLQRWGLTNAPTYPRMDHWMRD